MKLNDLDCIRMIWGGGKSGDIHETRLAIKGPAEWHDG